MRLFRILGPRQQQTGYQQRRRPLRLEQMERRYMLSAAAPAVAPSIAYQDVPAEPAVALSLDSVHAATVAQPDVGTLGILSHSADANGDGMVDGFDYAIWAQNYRTNTTRGSAAGEFNGNGKVDSLDYLVWANQAMNNRRGGASRLDGWDLATQGVPLPANVEELVATLNMLPPLPKTHHSVPWYFSTDNLALAEAIARTTGSVGLSTVDHNTLPEVQRAVRVAKSTGAVIDLSYSPYAKLYAKSDPRDWGEDFQAALAEINTTFANAASNLALAKQLEDAPDVQVGVIMLDQELLRSDIGPDGKPTGDGTQFADQLDALRAKNDLVYLAAKAAFPDAKVVWHSFPNSAHHSPDQFQDGVASTELYNNNGPYTLRYMVDKFVADVDAFNAAIGPSSSRQPLTELMPAVSLGGFYDVSVNGPNPGYVTDEPYPVKYSWFTGRNLNNPFFAREEYADRYGPTYRIDEVYLWPTPYGTDHTGYYEHLVAYVAGASNIKLSEGDWFDNLSR